MELGGFFVVVNFAGCVGVVFVVLWDVLRGLDLFCGIVFGCVFGVCQLSLSKCNKVISAGKPKQKQMNGTKQPFHFVPR